MNELAERLTQWLRKDDPEICGRVACETSVDQTETGVA